MSSTQDPTISDEDRQAMRARYTASRAKLVKNQKIEDGQASALMFAALAYGDVLENNALFASASHAAKLFCIAALFIIPNLLVIQVLL